MLTAKCASCQLISSGRTWCLGKMVLVSIFTKMRKRQTFHASSERKRCCIHPFFSLKIIGNIFSPCVLQVFFLSVTFFFAVSIHAVPGITHRSGV